MSPDFFTDNRARFVSDIAGGVAVFSAHDRLQAAGDAASSFQQEANFWWLCGINEPGWKLLIDGTATKSYLVAPAKSAMRELFDGGMSAEEAKRLSGVDAVIEADEYAQRLQRLAEEHEVVFTIGKDPHARYYDFSLNPAPQKLRTALKRYFDFVGDCRLELGRLRALKQPAEIAMIRQAVALTADSFLKAREALKPGMMEYEVEAVFTHNFRRSGAAGHAYEPIVAGGGRACTLHYCENAAALEGDDLLLIDIGARVGQYAADITRTYAVGEVSDRRRAVHGAVLAAHTQIIKLLRPGLQIKEYLRRVDEIMQQAVTGLGLDASEGGYRTYFPHAISHGLGIDVHESLGRYDEFMPGMVLTVEPGIYIKEEGIGVRIEDDILITATGHENLSANLPYDL